MSGPAPTTTMVALRLLTVTNLGERPIVLENESGEVKTVAPGEAVPTHAPPPQVSQQSPK